MSDLTTVEIETAGEDGSLPGPTERLTRRERSQVSRGGEGEPQDAGLTIEAGGDDDPMAALEASRRALAQRDEELASARRTADQERRAAAEARDQAARIARDRRGDQRAAVEGSLRAAEAQLESARAQYRQARETGDTDAELEAQSSLAEATYAKKQAEAYLAQNPAGQDQGYVPTPNNGTGGRTLSSAAQAWVDRNPRFNSDPQFRTHAMAAHQSAIDDGITTDSPAYFRFIDDSLKRAFPDHGGERGRGDDMSERFNGAPPNRGGSGGGSGNTVKTPFGPVQVHRRANGTMGVRIPQDRMEDWNEAARICGMSLKDYVAEQIQIKQELDTGGNAGMITTEGATFR